MLCAQGIHPVRTPLCGHADQPNRPPACVFSVAPVACLAAPSLVLRTRPTALAPPSTPPDDTDRLLKGKEKRRALVRKPSGFTACYGYGARCRQRRPHWDTMHVASIHFKCFRCFRGMLQVFHTDVGCCICCNGCTRMLQTSVPNVSPIFFTCILQLCLPGRCICFTHMLQMFYLDVAYVCNSFLSVFASVSDTCLSVFHMFSNVYCKCCI
jgi:hypothetical protein